MLLFIYLFTELTFISIQWAWNASNKCNNYK